MPGVRAYFGDVFYRHRPSGFHPEHPGRLDSVVAGLKRCGLRDRLELVEPRPGGRDLALRVHDEDYVELVERACRSAPVMLDPDTYVSEGTCEAAYAVLGSVADAVSYCLGASQCRVLVLGRPPGHHAGVSGAAMGAPTLGFCIFNASALAAVLLADAGLRVLVVDFDLHHGNGSQEILYRDPRVVHLDLHQDPSTIYPGTGWPWETGEGEARGTKLNLVIPPGCGDDCYMEALGYGLELVERMGHRFDAVVFSMGFDAYQGDGLAASMRVTSHGYHRIASTVLERVKPRIVVGVLEGGYTLGLERGLPGFVSALLGLEDPVGDEPTRTSGVRLAVLRENMKSLGRELGLE